MKPIEIETWALRVLEQVESGSFVEDALVELKSEWPDPRKAARQIAGHANAARGARILWLIGADEKRGIVGADFNELASWHARMEAEFDGLAPSLFSLNVPLRGNTVATLIFETDRAPFVVRNPAFNAPNGGPVELEVPWREGTRTRSATRSDLIRLLAPLRLQPTVEVLGGTLTAKRRNQNPVPGTLVLSAYITFYIAPRDEQPIVFPFHRASAVAHAPERTDSELRFRSLDFRDASKRGPSMSDILSSISRRAEKQSVTVHTRLEPLEITGAELFVRGPGKLILMGDASLDDSSIESAPMLKFSASLVAAQEGISCRVECSCVRSLAKEGESLQWVVSPKICPDT